MALTEEQAASSPTAALENMTVRQKVNFVGNVALFPAITVMVLLRRRIGFNLLPPWRLWLMAGLLTLGPVMLTDLRSNIPFAAPPSSSGFFTALTLFAIIMLAAGLWQRWQRWQEFQQDKRWHSYYPGDSYIEPLLNKLPFRLWHHWVRRFVEPALVATLGLLLLPFLHALGTWLVIAALGLYLYEYVKFIRSVELTFEVHDGTVQHQLSTILYGRTGAPPVTPATGPMIVPTGPARDTERLRARREGRPVPPPSPPFTPTPAPAASMFESMPPLFFGALFVMVLLAALFAIAVSGHTHTTADATGSTSPAFINSDSSAPPIANPAPTAGPVMNVAGTWAGTANQNGGIPITYRAKFQQSGANVTGQLHKIAKTPQGNQEIVTNVSGTAYKDHAELHENSIVSVTPGGRWCQLKSVKFTPTGSGGLAGSWYAPPCPTGQLTLTPSGVF